MYAARCRGRAPGLGHWEQLDPAGYVEGGSLYAFGDGGDGGDGAQPRTAGPDDDGRHRM